MPIDTRWVAQHDLAPVGRQEIQRLPHPAPTSWAETQFQSQLPHPYRSLASRCEKRGLSGEGAEIEHRTLAGEVVLERRTMISPAAQVEVSQIERRRLGAAQPSWSTSSSTTSRSCCGPGSGPIAASTWPASRCPSGAAQPLLPGMPAVCGASLASETSSGTAAGAIGRDRKVSSNIAEHVKSMIDEYGQIWDWAINKGKAGNPGKLGDVHRQQLIRDSRMPVHDDRLCAVSAREARLGELEPDLEVAQNRLSDACALRLSAFGGFRSIMGRTSPVGLSSIAPRDAHAGSGGDRGRSRSIRRRISANTARGTATSASWNTT